MMTRWLLVGVLCVSASPAWASVLSDAARDLAVGSWVEMTRPSGIGAALGSTSSSGHVLTYGMQMLWDPDNASVYNCSNDHLVNHKCSKYTESTNAFSVLTDPPYAQATSHAWDHQTIDIYNRRMYHITAQPSGSIEAYYCDLAGNPTCTSWTAINNFDNAMANGIGVQAMGWAPWFGTTGKMVYAFTLNGTDITVKTFDPVDSSLATLGAIPYTGNPWPTFVDCTVHAPFLCYIGVSGTPGSTKFYTVNSSGTVTARATPPCDLHWNESDSIVEPVSGHLITMCGSGTVGLHVYNNTTNAWTLLSSGNTPPQTFAGGSPINNGIMLVSLPEHGVIMAVSAKQNASSTDSNFGVWLYKYANSWTYRSTASGVLNAQGFDTAGVFTTQVNTSSKVSGFGALGDPNSVRDTTVYASGSSSFKCHYTLNVGAQPCEEYWMFAGDGGSHTYFAESSTFWLQFAFRAGPDWIANGWNVDNNPKMFILHNNNSSCANEELTMINTATRNAISMYGECGAKPFETENGTTFTNSGPNFYRQSGWNTSPLGYQCRYNSGAWNTPNCFNMVADTWYTLTIKVSIGTWNTSNSSLEVWASEYGKKPRKVINIHSIPLKTDSWSPDGYDTVEFLGFMTSSTSNPVTDIWFDEAIWSTSPINPSAGALSASSASSDKYRLSGASRMTGTWRMQ